MLPSRHPRHCHPKWHCECSMVFVIVGCFSLASRMRFFTSIALYLATPIRMTRIFAVLHTGTFCSLPSEVRGTQMCKVAPWLLVRSPQPRHCNPKWQKLFCLPLWCVFSTPVPLQGLPLFLVCTDGVAGTWCAESGSLPFVPCRTASASSGVLSDIVSRRRFCLWATTTINHRKGHVYHLSTNFNACIS